MPRSIVPQLRDRSAEIAEPLITPLLELLHGAARMFGGDLDNFQILLAVALRTAEHPNLAKLLAESGEEIPYELLSLWTNVHAISASIGMPQEAVRRKVRALVDQGWLKRQGHSIRYTRKGAVAVGEIHAQIMRLAASNYTTVRQVLAAEALSHGLS